MKAPNLKKALLDGLKDGGVKATTKDSPSGRDFRVRVGEKTVAHVEKVANGGLRIYVRVDSLPRAIASKGFAETKSSGFAQTFKNASELGPAVDAIAYAADLAAKATTEEAA